MAGENGAEPRKSARSLGPLESQLMETVWASSEHLSVQEVCDRLGEGHNYKTVMTVLNRLVDKELLERELDGRAYRYKARQSREEFLRLAAADVVQSYLDAYGPDGAKHLSSAVASAVPEFAEPLAAPEPPASNGAYHPEDIHVHHAHDEHKVIQEPPHITPNGVHAYPAPARIHALPMKRPAQVPGLTPLVALLGVAIVLQIIALFRDARS